MATHLKLDEARRIVGNKRVRALQPEEIQYIFVQAPASKDQVVYVKEVALSDPPGPFEGLNRRVTGLEALTERVMAKELQLWDLALTMSDTKAAAWLHSGAATGDWSGVISVIFGAGPTYLAQVALQARKAYKEDEVVCSVSALHYDTEA